MRTRTDEFKVYRLEYFCYREGAIWRPYGPDPTWWILANAIRKAKSLIYDYADARVLDQFGRVLYQNANIA
jgi:hypothetical protein